MADTASSRESRAVIARMALAEYDDWTHGRGRYADPELPLHAGQLASLAVSAQWLLEAIEMMTTADPGQTSRANTAVTRLDTRGMRDVLNVLALRVPAAVLAAVDEAGA